MSASNHGTRHLSDHTLALWRFIERYPGAMTAEVGRSVAPSAPGLLAYRVPKLLESLRDRGYLRSDKVGTRCCWYVKGTPPGANELHADVPRMVYADAPVSQAPARWQAADYERITRAARVNGRAPAAARLVPIDTPWPDRYLSDRPGMRPGALDYRQHPSRRGDTRVYCYARPGQ